MSRVLKKLLSAATVMLVMTMASAPAWSLDKPSASLKDMRIRATAYDPVDVIQIDTTLGVVTQIQLSADEEYVTHAFGDSEAYFFQHVNEHLLLKPKVEDANTNLIFITTKRTYNFLLRYAKTRNGREVFRVALSYPESERQASEADSAEELVSAELARAADIVNWEGYSISGHRDIGPLGAWDDGAQTWIRFAPGQELPAIYFVDADGQEVVVNRHMADANTIVLHRVGARWHLRLGEQVAAIHNDATSQRRSLSTGTVSQQVERVLRDGGTQ